MHVTSVLPLKTHASRWSRCGYGALYYMKEVFIPVSIRMYGPALDTKPVLLKVPCDTVEEAHAFVAELLQELINEKAKRPPAYDSSFGNERLCACGHTYERHFDGYENNAPVGCKYCLCHVWKQPTEDQLAGILTRTWPEALPTHCDNCGCELVCGEGRLCRTCQAATNI